MIRLVRFGDAVTGLPANTLFHAGPPYRGTPPQAVLNAAQQAAVIGGLAADAESARDMLADGRIALRPAQDVNLAVPLSQVLAPSMWCFEVGDGTHLTYSPVSEGVPPALRFGSDDPACGIRARDWCAQVAAALNPLLQLHRIEPHALMLAALEAGDDCHARTMAGNEIFVNALPELDARMKADVQANPSFVLGIWMAWSAWNVRASGGPLAAIGGNGIEFGLRLRGELEWRVTPAIPPVGKYFQPEHAPQALGAIGDSALVDACGFGGQALRHAPTLVEEWSDVLPGDATTRPARILDPVSGVIDPERILACGVSPIINLAILHRGGAGAPIGRGHYCPPITLFHRGDDR